jgi:hypothetical protein
MGRDKTVIASAMAFYKVDNSFQRRLVAGPQPLKNILEKIGA